MNTLFFKNKLWIWLFISLLVLWFAYPILRVGYFLISDPIPEEQVFTLTETLIDDASRLNQSTHLGIIKLSPDLNQSIATLRDTLKRAQIKKQKVIPLGARHSMGKQSIGRDAIHIDLSAMNKMGMENGLLRVQAGARPRAEGGIVALQRGRSFQSAFTVV